MIYCPKCESGFSDDLSEATSLADHGMCVACHKNWQMEGATVRILEFKHIGPFDGCFHRFEYLFVEDDGIVDWIVFTPGHLSPEGVLAVAGGNAVGHIGSLFKDFTWYEWDQNLFDEIPYAYFPAFWRFAEETGLTFTWFCDECGNLQVDEPVHMAGWRGNGGVGIRVEGWLCEDCADAQRERYELSLE